MHPSSTLPMSRLTSTPEKPTEQLPPLAESSNVVSLLATRQPSGHAEVQHEIPVYGGESLPPLSDTHAQMNMAPNVAQDKENKDNGAPSEAGNEPLDIGGNFKADFQSALSNNFDFTGKFAHAELLSNAPSPGVFIDGVGLLDLPLSERDAELVIAASGQAPYGQGERTVINKEVRDTWEIAAERIRFTNPLWEPFMVNIAKSVSTRLGVTIAASAPRIELYKLLLYETGSHFLPHKDHEKTKGMFATIIIILPSTYTGGQVHVSHSQTTDVFDFSANSAFGTALLSWYTDVTHEVKPVQSGYRLALSYNLIHTAPNTLPPMLPDMSAAALELRRVLRKWKNDMYEDSHLKICYLLDHHYSPANLEDSALKGVDAHRLSFLQPLCEELGFKIYLANLECYMSGCPYDAGSDDDSSNCGHLKMKEILYTTLDVKGLRDLQGRPPVPDLRDLDIGFEDLIPEDSFEDNNPDKKEYEGYMGNQAGSLDYWYHRTVMILWHESMENDLHIEFEGFVRSLKKLEDTGNPTTAEQNNIFNYYLKRLCPVPSHDGKVVARTLTNAAIVWNNVDLWADVIKASGADHHVDILGVEGHVRALKAFSLEELRTVFEDLIQTEASFTARINFIHQFSSAIRGDGAFDAWCCGQIIAVLGNLRNLIPDDCPVLIAEAEKHDISCLRDTILPQLKKMNLSRSVWLQFVKALRARVEVLILPKTPPHPWHYARFNVNAILDDVFQVMLEQISVTAPFPQTHAETYRAYYINGVRPTATIYEQVITDTLELLELCISMNRLDDCQALFQKLLDPLPTSQAELEKRFSFFFKPFVSKLIDFIQKNGLREDMPPFKNLFKALIRLYLDRLVGMAPPEIDPKKWKPKTIGCGCGDCSELDHFIMSAQGAITFRITTERREHLLSRIWGNADGARYLTEVVTSGSPHQLVVTKDPDARPSVARAWLVRRSNADEFMRSIGDKELLQRILSDEVNDRSADVAPVAATAQAGPSHQTAAAHAGAAGAQAKRSHPSDVMDLT